MLIDTLLPEYILNSIIFKLIIASFLGALIGFERDIHGRAAGLRTHLLVSLGAAVFMLLSETISSTFSNNISESLIRSDPTRIAAQIVTGIGFLGAGAIIKSGLTIRGLTTAACLWLSAGIGMSVGAGFFMIATVTTTIGLFSLIFLNKLEKFYSKDSYRVLQVVTSNETDASNLIDVIKRKTIKILFLDIDRDYDTNTLKLNFTLRLHHKDVTDKLSHDLIDDLEKSKIILHKIKWNHQ